VCPPGNSILSGTGYKSWQDVLGFGALHRLIWGIEHEEISARARCGRGV
jgi:hypothetical protein